MSGPGLALLPCPFCGGSAALNTITYSPSSEEANLNGQTVFHGVNCIACTAWVRGVVGYLTPARAAEAWNRRAAPEADRG